MTNSIINSLPPVAIENFVKLAVGTDIWSDILALITLWDTKQVSNAEKKKAVLSAVKEIASDFGEILLGIAIDLTVLWLRKVTENATT